MSNLKLFLDLPSQLRDARVKLREANRLMKEASLITTPVYVQLVKDLHGALPGDVHLFTLAQDLYSAMPDGESKRILHGLVAYYLKRELQ